MKEMKEPRQKWHFVAEIDFLSISFDLIDLNSSNLPERQQRDVAGDTWSC